MIAEAAIKQGIQERRDHLKRQLEALDSFEQTFDIAFSDSEGVVTTAPARRTRGRPKGSGSKSGKRGPGRPKGSGSKSKRGPGRPKGSRSAPKADAAHTSTTAEVGA